MVVASKESLSARTPRGKCHTAPPANVCVCVCTHVCMNAPVNACMYACMLHTNMHVVTLAYMFAGHNISMYVCCKGAHMLACMHREHETI